MNKFKEKQVIKLLKQSPEEGLKMAIEIYGSAVKTICTNILDNLEKEDIEEAISDTFFKLWKNIDNFKTNKNTSLKSYVYAIARNVCFDKLRRLNLNLSLFDIDENNLGVSINMYDEYAKIQNEKIIKETLNKFKEPDKSIFILRFFYFEKINTSKTYIINKNYKVDGKNIRVKTIEISPLSARIKINGKCQEFISKVTMKDGTIYKEDAFFINNSASYSTPGRNLFGKSEIYTGFSKILNVNDIKSITINDKIEIELP